VGARFGHFFVHTGSYSDTVANTAGMEFNDTENHSSWSTSVSYSLPLGLRPYVTIARQAALTTGEGGEIDIGSRMHFTRWSQKHNCSATAKSALIVVVCRQSDS
jgi:hypothetical protein